MTNATQTQLEPCPFCRNEFRPMAAQDKDGHTVVCVGCSALGPSRRSQAEAITAWNTRIESARPVSEAGVEAEPIGYIIAEMLNRKSEFERNGIVMTAAPQGMSTLPLYAARPVQSELVEASSWRFVLNLATNHGKTRDEMRTVFTLIANTAETALAALKETDNG